MSAFLPEDDADLAFAVAAGSPAMSMAPELRVYVEGRPCRIVVQRAGLAPFVEPCGSVSEGVIAALRLARCAGLPVHPALCGRRGDARPPHMRDMP